MCYATETTYTLCAHVRSHVTPCPHQLTTACAPPDCPTYTKAEHKVKLLCMACAGAKAVAEYEEAQEAARTLLELNRGDAEMGGGE